MKIVCDSAKLAKLCMNVQRTVSSKSTIPAIEGILIDALGDSIRLTGYDLEVGTETYLEAEVEENGSIILNAKNFCDILRMLPDETVSIESDERNICKIKSGETEYSIIGTSAEEYPDLPTISGGFPIRFSVFCLFSKEGQMHVRGHLIPGHGKTAAVPAEDRIRRIFPVCHRIVTGCADDIRLIMAQVISVLPGSETAAAAGKG